MGVLLIVGMAGVACILVALVVDITLGPGPRADYQRIVVRDTLFGAGVFFGVGAFVLAATVAFIQSFTQ